MTSWKGAELRLSRAVFDVVINGQVIDHYSIHDPKILSRLTADLDWQKPQQENRTGEARKQPAAPAVRSRKSRKALKLDFNAVRSSIAKGLSVIETANAFNCSTTSINRVLAKHQLNVSRIRTEAVRSGERPLYEVDTSLAREAAAALAGVAKQA